MGVEGLSTPYIRDHKNATNAKFDEVTKNSELPVVVGFDISVMIISLMRQNSSMISLYHTEPKVPMPELAEKVAAQLRSCFKHGMGKAVLAFDGLTHKLKKDHAHKTRYKNLEASQEELRRLYGISSFATQTEDNVAIARVKKLRAELSPIRQDIIHSIKTKVEDVFGDKVVCIGSPYEADHQLASLYKQGIIDYVVTTDSDLICLGATVLIGMNLSSSACWIMTMQKMLSERLPSKFKTKEEMVWSQDLLIELACFSGNDFIGRVPGNGPKKVKNFVEAIVDLDNDQKYQYIYDSVIIASAGKKCDRSKWDDPGKKDAHLQLWKRASAMFLHGPAFIVEPKDMTVSARDSLFSREFTTRLGSMSGSHVNWKQNIPSEDGGSIEHLLLGFDPFDDLIDKLDLEVPEIQHDETSIDRHQALLHECFTLHRWAKTGEVFKPLVSPVDSKGRELYFGSIIDFDKIPVHYHSIEELKFYLDSRQMRSLPRVAEIRRTVTMIWKSHGTQLQPIPKVLMRGVSGWIKEEIFCMSEEVENISWLKNEELLPALVKSFPDLTEELFSSIFKKRNGTRLRVMKYIQGGSFDLLHIKATYDMVHKLHTEKKLLVIEAVCAPSQKLKEGGKDSFHSQRLCIEVHSDSLKFVKVFEHPATTTCTCPNGAIICAHQGGLIVLCYAIVQV